MNAWKVVQGRTRCQQCGEFVAQSWRFFITPAQSTVCYCLPCAEKLTSTTPSE